MPRTYTEVTDEGVQTISADDKYSSAESFITGNTDFDAIYNPITAFNFVLEVEAIYFLPLRSIKGFTKENEFEYIREGGVNDYVHMKRKPISKPFTFQVEKYVGTERFLDPLALGTELILPLLLYVYRHKARQGLSESAPAYPARIYIFTGCTVISKEYGELNAEQSSILTETTTIAYRELIVIPNPFQSSSEKEEWTSKEKYGDGSLKTKYAAFPPNDNKNSSSYAYENKDGHLVKKGEEPYSIQRDGAKTKHAKQTPIDKLGGIYEEDTGPDGSSGIKRVDSTNPLLNKPAWTGEDGAKVKWAKETAGNNPEPVIWPQTRRAMMADALKK